jgi:lysozyme family protein
MGLPILTEKFKTALKFVLEQEGGYVNDPDDVGGETYQGISRKYHPSWDGWKIIDEIKEEYAGRGAFPEALLQERVYPHVPAFYKENFWDLLNLDKIVSDKIAIKLFDMAVNIGVPRTAHIAQTSLNLMSYDGDYLKVDNIIGNITINLINEMTKKDNGEFLLQLLTLQQGSLYMKLVQNNPIQKKFIHGWINRLGIKIADTI